MKKLLCALLLLITAGSSAVIRADENDTETFSTYPPIATDSLAGTRFRFTAGGGQDRCSTEHCICQVNPDPPKTTTNTNRYTERRLSVYFSEGKSTLNDTQVRQVKGFLEAQSTNSFTVVGYTDSCGTHEYNKGLARDRVAAVSSSMKSTGRSFSIDSTVFNAEHAAGHDPSVRRVDLIAHTTSRLTTMLDKIQADVYLIDASGSMWSGWKNWVDVIAVSFRPGARVYLSKTMDCHNGQRLSKVRPGGGTEIWYSYWKIIEWMKPGETLAVISDFRSDVPLTRRESAIIEQKVHSAKINVIAISP